MPNMSYCRFENTNKDLRDCMENWDIDGLNDYELRGMKGILNSTKRIFESLGIDFDQEAFDEALADIDVALKEFA